MTRFSSAVGLCSILYAFRGWKLFVSPVKPTTTKSAWGQTWRFRNHQENGGLLFMPGCVTFMVSLPPMCVRWGLPQLFVAFSTPAPSSSLTESSLRGPQERKTVWWSWVPPPPREGVNLNGKSVFAVDMVCTVCPWDKTLNYDWGLPLAQVPPSSAFHTHSCPVGYCPLRSPQTKYTNIKLVHLRQNTPI